MSSLSLEVCKQTIAPSPSPAPGAAEGIPALGWGSGACFGQMKMLLQPQELQLTHSFTQHTFTKACSVPGQRHWAPGVGGAEQEKPHLSIFPTPIQGGEAKAGQGAEDGGPGCPHSMSQV